MRKIRTSAIALLSVAALSLTGVTAASAQDSGLAGDLEVSTNADLNLDADLSLDEETTDEETTEEDAPGIVEMISSNGSSLPGYGKDLEADKEGYGTDGFGSSRDDSGEEVPRWLSAWGKIFDVVTVGGVLGMIVFPIVNFLKYNGIIK